MASNESRQLISTRSDVLDNCRRAVELLVDVVVDGLDQQRRDLHGTEGELTQPASL